MIPKNNWVTLSNLWASLEDSSTKCTIDRGSKNNGHRLRATSTFATLFFSLTISLSLPSTVYSKASPVSQWSSMTPLGLTFLISIYDPHFSTTCFPLTLMCCNESFLESFSKLARCKVIHSSSKTMGPLGANSCSNSLLFSNLT